MKLLQHPLMNHRHGSGAITVGPVTIKVVVGALCDAAQRGLWVPHLGLWVLRLPMDCAEMLPATLPPAGEDQPVDEPGQDLMLSAGSRPSVDPMLEQASLWGEERPHELCKRRQEGWQQPGKGPGACVKSTNWELPYSCSRWALPCGTSTDGVKQTFPANLALVPLWLPLMFPSCFYKRPACRL